MTFKVTVTNNVSGIQRLVFYLTHPTLRLHSYGYYGYSANDITLCTGRYIFYLFISCLKIKLKLAMGH